MEQQIELFVTMVRESSGSRTAVFLYRFDASQNCRRSDSIAIMRECQRRGRIVSEVRFGVEYLSYVR